MDEWVSERMNEHKVPPRCMNAQAFHRKESLRFAGKKACLLHEPLGTLRRWRPQDSWTCPLALLLRWPRLQGVWLAAAAASPAQPGLCAALALWGSGVKEQWWHCRHFPIPSLSQLLIKDVGGPAPEHSVLVPWLSGRHAQTGALQEVADEFITGHSNDPTAVDLGCRWVNGRSMTGGLLQRPHPFPRRGPGESDGKGWVYGLLVRRQFLDWPTSVDRLVAALVWLVCLQLRWGFLKTLFFLGKKKPKQHFITLLLKFQVRPSAPGIKSQALRDLTSNAPSPFCSLCFAHLLDFWPWDTVVHSAPGLSFHRYGSPLPASNTTLWVAGS